MARGSLGAADDACPSSSLTGLTGVAISDEDGGSARGWREIWEGKLGRWSTHVRYDTETLGPAGEFTYRAVWRVPRERQHVHWM